MIIVVIRVARLGAAVEKRDAIGRHPHGARREVAIILEVRQVLAAPRLVESIGRVWKCSAGRPAPTRCPYCGEPALRLAAETPRLPLGQQAEGVSEAAEPVDTSYDAIAAASRVNAMQAAARPAAPAFWTLCCPCKVAQNGNYRFGTRVSGRTADRLELVNVNFGGI